MNGSYRRYRFSQKLAQKVFSKLLWVFSKDMTILETFVCSRKFGWFSKICDLEIFSKICVLEKLVISKICDLENFWIFRNLCILESLKVFEKKYSSFSKVSVFSKNCNFENTITQNFRNYPISKICQKSKCFLSYTREKSLSTRSVTL